MRHLRIIATGLVIVVASMMFVLPASSQITIRLNSAQRSRHYGYYHSRHEVHQPHRVVYYHRHVVYHRPHAGVRIRLNVR